MPLATQLLPPKTTYHMVVHHPGGLHKGIADGGSDEGKPALPEILAHVIGFRRTRRHIFHAPPAVIQRLPIDESPDELIETAEFFLDRLERLRILHGGVNLEPVADDAGIRHQRYDLLVIVAGDLTRIK